MGQEIQTYPTGTPGAGDVVVYVEDPGGTPALKLGDQAAFVGSAGVDGMDGADGADGADGQGVPAGGGSGQVLTKDSGTDFDTSWQTPSGGGGGGNFYASSGNPNDDVTVPSPPDDVRALAYDRDSVGLDLYKWDVAETISYTDTFDGTIDDPAPNGADYTSEPSDTWTQTAGILHADGGSFRFRTADWGDGDADVTVVLNGSADNLGVGLRHTDSDNWVRLVADNSNMYLDANIAGSFVNWATYGGGGGSGVELRLVADGNVYTAYRDDVLLGTFTDTGSNFLTVPNHGVMAQGTSVGFQAITVVVPNPLGGYSWLPVGSGLA